MAAKVPWIGTSWKMNKTRQQARAFADARADSPIASSDALQSFVVPPFTAIADVAAILAGTRVRVGAQNMHWAEAGPWTGEVSASMIKDVGASLVEIGHSERREHFGETDETVALKAKAAVAHGLVALVCVGDTRAEHEAGETSPVLARQVRAALSGIDRASCANVVIAYEPVWSIGEGGAPADPDFVDLQHRGIKEIAKGVFGAPVDVVYGGSVNPDNCRRYMTRANVDGLFIGRSAWEAAGYIDIVEIVLGLRRS